MSMMYVAQIEGGAFVPPYFPDDDEDDRVSA